MKENALALGVSAIIATSDSSIRKVSVRIKNNLVLQSTPSLTYDGTQPSIARYLDIAILASITIDIANNCLPRLQLIFHFENLALFLRTAFHSPCTDADNVSPAHKISL